MKLSDLFASMSRSAQDFEARVAKWQDQLADKGDELQESVRKWQETAKQRQDEMNTEIQTYFDDASDAVKT